VKPFEIHPEDRVGGGPRFLGVVDEFDTAGLSAPADLYLCFDRDWIADLIGRRDRVVDGRGKRRVRTGIPASANTPFAWYS